MYRDKISLPQAKALELIGEITIVDSSPESITPFGESGKKWKENFITLQTRHRHISPGKLLDFLSARYLIEIFEGEVDRDSNTYSWRYLHGIENTRIKSKNIDNIEYVYVLVNPAYPSLVKVGMTIHDVPGRVTSINATATVEEWVPKFALPVKRGTAMKVEKAVHKYFSSVRVCSDRGGSREFFKVTPFEAFDKIREVGVLFQVGEPVIY
jgi:hypothetical protein